MINILFLADDIVLEQKEIQKKKKKIIFKEILGKQLAKISYSDYRYVEKLKSHLV